MKQSYGNTPIEWLDEIDSTNSELRRRIGALDNLSVIAARYQTAGRGQGTHTWLSPEDENLTFSVLLRFGKGGLSPLPATEAVRITQMATLSIRSFLLSEGVESRIKWPNDIWVGDKKICGMLIENILDGKYVASSIVGIGVNLNQKAGPGYSGENAGISMIVTNKDVQASNEKFVAYQCRYGNSLEFNLASDGEADAVLYVRLAAEFSDMTLTPDIYEISVNGEPLQYKDISLTMAEGSQQGTFEDYLVGTVHLNKGENLIQLKTVNHEALGGTLTATAPIIDSIRVETEAVVIWDGAFGLPMKNY